MSSISFLGNDFILVLQELTNRLQLNLNDKYLTELANMNARMKRIEDMLSGTGDTNVTFNIFDKVAELEQKLDEQNRNVEDKLNNLSGDNLDHNTRLDYLENQDKDKGDKIEDIQNDLKARDDDDSLQKMIQVKCFLILKGPMGIVSFPRIALASLSMTP